MRKAQQRARPRFYVNGRYLGRPVTGVERFANGILDVLNTHLTDEALNDWTVLLPEGMDKDRTFSRLETQRFGRLKGHVWEQVDLLRASRAGILINLCNSGPILHPRQMTVIHDALVYRFPQGFSRTYRTLHGLMGRALARTSRLATVSAFSQEELSHILRVPRNDIPIIPNAVGHLDAIVPDTSVLLRLGLTDRPFLLFVGSPAPNKNLKAAFEGFKSLRREDVAFVLVGLASKAFSQGITDAMPGNCLRPGRLSDAEIKALYMHARALVFPSVYEGFGIPPLEAMSVGCPVLAADIPVVREVCADAALYFDPEDVASIATAMERALDPQNTRGEQKRLGTERAALFSWEKSAKQLLKIVEAL